MRIVLDTNVVLDLVVFRDPGVGALRAAIEAARVKPLASRASLDELRRVLAYPAFELDPSGQDAAFGWYESLTEFVEAPPALPFMPRCRDADDQKFLNLAWTADATHLVTKDKALLELAPRVARLGKFSITSLADLRLATA